MSIGRQAVIVIHGIGEQRPMSTLRRFVAAVGRGDYQSKPDRLSNLFELRRLNIGGPHKPPETHFYELYWAHHLEGSKLAQLGPWLLKLTIRMLPALGRGSAPPLPCDRRRVFKAMGWAMAVVVLAAVLTVGTVILVFYLVDKGNWQGATGGALVAALLAFIYRMLTAWPRRVLGDIVADAPRYLEARPENIAARQSIRATAVQLLTELHRSSRGYERVIVIGHSIGSVIGYDALKHYWAEVNNAITIDGPVASLLERVEGYWKPDSGDYSQAAVRDKVRKSRSDPDVVLEFQNAQSDLLRGLPQRDSWLVTDFITVGSPLHYAALLVADGPTDFDQRVQQRELPSCPPHRSERENPGSFGWRREGEPIHLHHAALFALTRWTNFYSQDDLIGGPLQRVFGPGIRDECVEGHGVVSHVRYWSDRGENQFVTDLRQILEFAD